MTDDPSLDPPDPDEQRAALHHIIGYRRLRRSIRSSGTGTLVWGLFMLGIWYVAFYQMGRAGTVLAMIHLALGAGEVVVGLFKKLVPVPEAYLLEALVFVGFAAANGYRYWDQRQNGGVFAAGFALYMLFAAWGRVQVYRQLLRARFRRPGRDQLRWFDDLLTETRAADPEADPNSLDLPTEPPVRMKLLGDTALVLEPGQADPEVVGRDSVHIDREPPAPGERWPSGYLTIGGEDAGRFEVDDFNWKNYAAWKTAGGDPPPPIRVVPARGE